MCEEPQEVLRVVRPSCLTNIGDGLCGLLVNSGPRRPVFEHEESHEVNRVEDVNRDSPKDLIRSKYNTNTAMPVDFHEYSAEQGRIDLTEGTNGQVLLSFLLEYPGVGFTPAELHEETGVARGSVSPTLSRLERAGLVRHEGNYWAAAEDDRLAAASASVVGLAAVEEDYGDDWYGRNPNWAEDLPDISGEE